MRNHVCGWNQCFCSSCGPDPSKLPQEHTKSYFLLGCLLKNRSFYCHLTLSFDTQVKYQLWWIIFYFKYVVWSVLHCLILSSSSDFDPQQHQVILQTRGDWKQRKWEKGIIFEDNPGISRALVSGAMWEKKPRIFSPSSSSSWLFLNNWKLSKAEQFCPTEWEKILQWAPVARRWEKKKRGGLRFVISLPLCGVSPLLHGSSPGLCTEKVIQRGIQLLSDIYTVSLQDSSPVEQRPRPLFLTWNNSVRHSQCTSTLNVVIITCSRCLRADPESAWSPLPSNQSWYESAKHSSCNDGRLFNIAHHYFNEWMNVLNLENMPLIGAAVFRELLPRCEPPGFGESRSCADDWATWS